MNRLVVLDEIHQLPKIFQTLRSLIDRRRQNILNALPGSTRASFYRTAAAAEVDLVLELGKRLR